MYVLDLVSVAHSDSIGGYVEHFANWSTNSGNFVLKIETDLFFT